MNEPEAIAEGTDATRDLEGAATEAPAPAPTLTDRHTRKLKYQVGDKVLLQPVNGTEITLGVVVGMDKSSIGVEITTGAMAKRAMTFRRRSGVSINAMRLLGRYVERVVPLDDLTYDQLQGHLFELGIFVAGLPLDRMLERIRLVHLSGPRMNPEGYRANLPRLRALERLATALQPFKDVAIALASTPAIERKPKPSPPGGRDTDTTDTDQPPTEEA